MFDANVEANGKGGYPDAGIVEGVSIEGAEYEEGTNFINVIFKQSNGTEVKPRLYEPNPEWAKVEEARIAYSQRIKHIGIKVGSEESYNAAIGTSASFAELAKKYVKYINDNKSANKYRMKFVYDKKGFVTIPLFPNFIETEATNPTTLYINPKYDVVIRPIPDVEEAPEPLEAKSDLPF